ncbi:MAG: DUF883 family protein [Deinococcota bacterium]|nr:hypothetical protein [Allomeiothermus silvanus]MCL6568949.1 apolipoprotein A1/A4/E family protein [Allomeiothermus silvanus]
MVRDASQVNVEVHLSPDQEVEAAKERLRAAFQRAGEELGQTADRLQSKVLETADGLKDRVQDTVHHLQAQVTSIPQEVGAQISEAVHKPIQVVRERPLESVGVALLAGFITGQLLGLGGRSGTRSASPDYGDGEAYGEATGYAPTPTTPQPARSNSRAGLGGWVEALGLGALGKAAMDVIREEYLTPENIRYWVNGLLSRRKP